MSVKITYFVHGITTDNEEGLATGWAQGELSELGIKLSHELKESVSGENFDAVFSSDLKRAIDTAEICFGNVIQDERLRECNYGDLERKPKELFKDNITDYIDTKFPNGESYKDVEKRISEFLAFLKENYEGKRVSIVSHHAPQMALDVLLKGKSWEQAFEEDWRKGKEWKPGWEYLLK